MEQKTVAELKQMCRDRGLKLEHKGHKFNKKELIVNIKLFDAEKEAEESEKRMEENKIEIRKNKPKRQEVVEVTKKEIVKLTFDVIDKYSEKTEHSKNVESKNIEVGDFIAYIRYITTKAGKLIKKVGTAKVVSVEKDSCDWCENVIVETPIGENVEINIEDVLYVRSADERIYPNDISELLFKQRLEYKAYKEKLEQEHGSKNEIN